MYICILFLGSATPLSACYIHFHKVVYPLVTIFNGRRVQRELTRLIEQTKHLSIGRIGDLRFAGQIVGLDTIAGSDAILAKQQTESRMFGEIVDLLRFALDDHLAKLVALNCVETGEWGEAALYGGGGRGGGAGVCLLTRCGCGRHCVG